VSLCVRRAAGGSASGMQSRAHSRGGSHARPPGACDPPRDMHRPPTCCCCCAAAAAGLHGAHRHALRRQPGTPRLRQGAGRPGAGRGWRGGGRAQVGRASASAGMGPARHRPRHLHPALGHAGPPFAGSASLTARRSLLGHRRLAQAPLPHPPTPPSPPQQPGQHAQHRRLHPAALRGLDGVAAGAAGAAVPGRAPGREVGGRQRGLDQLRARQHAAAPGGAPRQPGGGQGAAAGPGERRAQRGEGGGLRRRSRGGAACKPASQLRRRLRGCTAPAALAVCTGAVSSPSPRRTQLHAAARGV
jgi:hypothetical protein